MKCKTHKQCVQQADGDSLSLPFPKFFFICFNAFSVIFAQPFLTNKAVAIYMLLLRLMFCGFVVLIFLLLQCCCCYCCCLY